LDERVLIDATKKGSMARFVRRSCRPNATMQHAIIDGKLRFYLYATTNIDNSTEVSDGALNYIINFYLFFLCRSQFHLIMIIAMSRPCQLNALAAKIFM